MAKEVLSDKNRALIDEFTDMLWLEKGLSEHTQQSYRTDLSKLALFCQAKEKIDDISLLYTESVQAWLQYRHEAGLSARSTQPYWNTIPHVHLPRTSLCSRLR